MAEFQEVAKAYVRMCESYSTCEGCPIQALGNDIDSCRCCVFKWPEKYESKIMKWAAENPEMVYPTWFEYLYAISNPDYFNLTEFYTWMRHTPIPADIAQKLGIEPKE